MMVLKILQLDLHSMRSGLNGFAGSVMLMLQTANLVWCIEDIF